MTVFSTSVIAKAVINIFDLNVAKVLFNNLPLVAELNIPTFIFLSEAVYFAVASLILPIANLFPFNACLYKSVFILTALRFLPCSFSSTFNFLSELRLALSTLIFFLPSPASLVCALIRD